MTSTPEEPSALSDPPSSPMDAAKRYASPDRKITNPGSQSFRGSTSGSDAASPEPTWSTNPRLPMILGIAGVVGWFLCGVGAIGSIIVGRIGQRKARELGQSELLPKIAWIGGIVVVILDVIGFIVLPTTYSR